MFMDIPRPPLVVPIVPACRNLAEGSDSMELLFYPQHRVRILKRKLKRFVFGVQILLFVGGNVME